MGFYYASEKYRFDGEWLELEEQYRKAGMDEADIQAMRDFDWEWFKQRRTYENRVQTLPAEVIDDNDESRSTLFSRFTALATGFEEGLFLGRYGWIDSVSDPILLDKLFSLSDADKELLTLLVFDGYTQTEIATIQGCSQQSISKKFGRIKIFLK